MVDLIRYENFIYEKILTKNQKYFNKYSKHFINIFFNFEQIIFFFFENNIYYIIQF